MKKLMMMAAAGLVASQAWAAEFQAKAVSDSARWVVHADLEQLKQTTMGMFLMGQLQSGEAGNKVSALAAILQFDPRKDLTSVTLYGKSKDPQQAVAMFEGAVNMPQLVTLLKANPSYETVMQGATTIHSWIDEKKPEARSYGCFHSGKVLISQGLPALREAIDVLDGTHPALDTAKIFGELPVDQPFFMAGTDLPGLGGQAQAQMLGQAKVARVALGEKAGMVNLSVVLTTVDAETAVKLQQVAQGLLAMGQMNDKEPELAALLQAAKVTVDGAVVQLNLSYATDRVLVMIQEKMHQSAPRPAAAAAPAAVPAAAPIAP